MRRYDRYYSSLRHLILTLRPPTKMLRSTPSFVGLLIAYIATSAPLMATAIVNPMPPQYRGAASLRSLLSAHLAAGTAVALPGVHDALSARVFAEAGAEALFLSGFGVSACRLGQPDAGVLTLSEMKNCAEAVISAAGGGSVPVIVDGDTGYGGAPNIRMTVRGLAAAGAAAVTIEDQVFPKRCTYAAGTGVKVVSREASLARIRCALGARDEAKHLDGNDILVVARTDCRAAMGLDEAVERCVAYEEAGADIVYAENLQSREEYIHLRQALRAQTPTILAQVQQFPGDGSDEKEKLYTLQELGNMKYSLALFGVTALQATVQSLRNTAEAFLHPEGGAILTGDNARAMASFSDIKDAVGFNELDEFEAQYNVEY